MSTLTEISHTESPLGRWPSGAMHALGFTAPGRIDVLEVDIPRPQPGHVLAEVSHVGICGTDVHLLSGHSAYVVGGSTSYPIRFGHEWAGRVVAVADDVDQTLLGTTVVGEPFLSCGQCRVCRGGHYQLCPHRHELGVRGELPGAAATYFAVPATNVAVVPPGVRPELALMAEPSVTVLHAYESGRVQPGERVAVVGTGAIGLIAVQVGVAMGCLVDTIGIDEAGLAAATAFGARAGLRPDEAEDDAYDVVIEASGAGAVAPMLTRVSAIGARILALGIPGRPVDGVDVAAFVSKGLSLVGVLGGVHLLPRALQLIAQGAIRPDLLLDEVLAVDAAEEAFARCGSGGRQRPKVVLDLRTLGARQAVAG